MQRRLDTGRVMEPATIAAKIHAPWRNATPPPPQNPILPLIRVGTMHA